jgi:hypothetical protein
MAKKKAPAFPPPAEGADKAGYGKAKKGGKKPMPFAKKGAKGKPKKGVNPFAKKK